MARVAALPALTLFLLLLGCTESPSAPRYSPAEQVAGSWRWISSLDVNTQRLHTPATEGFEAELRFRADSEDAGTFTYLRGGAVATQGRFSISYKDAPGNDFIVLEPGIDFLERNAWLAVGSDSLHLGGVMELGYNSRYHRVPE